MKLHTLTALAFVAPLLTAGLIAPSASALPVVRATTDAVLFGDYLDVYGTASEALAATPIADAPLEIFLTGFASADGVRLDTADLTLSDGGVDWLVGSLARMVYEENPSGDDTLRLWFGDLTGAAAGEFRAEAIAVMVGEFGATPFATDGALAEGVTAELSVSSVPVPGAAALMLGALGALVGLRRRRS